MFILTFDDLVFYIAVDEKKWIFLFFLVISFSSLGCTWVDCVSINQFAVYALKSNGFVKIEIFWELERV